MGEQSAQPAGLPGPGEGGGGGSSPSPVAAPAPPVPPAAGVAPAPPNPPDQSAPRLAALLFAAAVVVILLTSGRWLWKGKSLGYTGGGAAVTVGILLVLALILRMPLLIMDDAPASGGEPSTMRILTLAIVLTFCALMLRTGWNDGSLPSLQDQKNWVWLVTSALGGKAVQRFAEVQEKKVQKK